jgi:glycerophosphoryl diester phosphodiesterase
MAAQLAAPQLPRGWLVKTPVEQDFQRLRRMGCVSLHCSHAEIDRAGIARFHGEGYRVLVYTVNDPARAETLLEWGVDGLFTDKLAVFAERFPALT